MGIAILLSKNYRCFLSQAKLGDMGMRRLLRDFNQAAQSPRQ